MREALNNLLENALRYAGPQSTITLLLHAGKPEESLVTLQVADDGPGVSPMHLSHLFDRFWRADPNTTDGSGIGLSLVARVAELHHGKASARAAEPHGLVVEMVLPAVPTPATLGGTPAG